MTPGANYTHVINANKHNECKIE